MALLTSHMKHTNDDEQVAPMAKSLVYPSTSASRPDERLATDFPQSSTVVRAV